MNGDPKVSVNGIVLWLTLITLVGGAVAFFDSIHSKYVTKEELKILVLSKEKEQLEREMKYEQSNSKTSSK
jgi:hypothetical protein